MEHKKIKVLICDDSILVRKQMKDHLTSLNNVEFDEATDGIQAVEKYKNFRPDVVFMDIVMPEKTGIDALIEILAYDKNAKVVMASSVGTQSKLKNAIEAGAFDFLQKPIEMDQIDKILNAISNGRG